MNVHVPYVWYIALMVWKHKWLNNNKRDKYCNWNFENMIFWHLNIFVRYGNTVFHLNCLNSNGNLLCSSHWRFLVIPLWILWLNSKMTLLISLFTYNIRCLSNILSPNFLKLKKIYIAMNLRWIKLQATRVKFCN